MIYINDGDFKDTTNTNGASAIIMPVAGRYHWLAKNDISVENRYKSMPGSLQWFVHTYCLQDDIEGAVKSASLFYNITPIFGGYRNLSRHLLCGHIPKDVKAPAVTEAFLKYKPHVITPVIMQSFRNYEVSQARNNYLSELDDKLTVKIIEDSITEAVRSSVTQNVTNKILIAPLFSENGYHEELNKADREWLETGSYLRNMLNLLNRFTFKDGIDVVLFHKNYKYAHARLK